VALTLSPVSLVVFVFKVFCANFAHEDKLIQGVHDKSSGFFGGDERELTLWALIALPGPVRDTVSAVDILTVATLGSVQARDTRTDRADQVLVEWLGQAFLGLKWLHLHLSLFLFALL
jgi:hypothetical protein